MKKFKWIQISVYTFIFFASGCSPKKGGQPQGKIELPYYKDPTFTPYWIGNTSPELDSFHTISDFKLINQDSIIITHADLENKIYVADFFFTFCPGICPQMTENMKIIQEEFINDPGVVLISHSVTPRRDSVPILKKYADKKGVISGKWHLLTGPQKEIYKLGRKDYFIEEDLGIEKDLDEFLHTENFVLIDKDKHIRGIYNGLNLTSVRELIKDIQTLKGS